MKKRRKRRQPRQKFLKVKVKVNKKHLKKVIWGVSILLAGFLAFALFQHSTKREPTPSRPPVSKVTIKTTSTRKTSLSKPTVRKAITYTPTAHKATTYTPKAVTYTPPPVRKPSASTRPAIVFVIDDIGYHNRLKGQLQKLGNKITYAILPLLPYSRHFGNLGKQTGAEVILHLPLEPTQDIVPGPGLVVSAMNKSQILDMLARDLRSVPNCVGVNNHMGSRGTADRELMTIILKDLKRRGLFFLDSYTSGDSVVASVARAIGVPFLKRGVFLDNVDEKSAILAQIRQLRLEARQKRSAIAIGHYRANTLEVIAQEIPRLEAEGFEIISLRDLLRRRR